ncbi:Toll/interleukin-1 receptor domain-containing protein [Tanacetum coccineum]
MLMKGLTNMKELRFLHVTGPRVREDDVSNWNLPNALRFLRWRGYPFSSLPKTFQAKYLVGLQMFNSKMVKLWKDGEEKPFPNLKLLMLYTAKALRTLDLSVAPNLETLILGYSDNLLEVHFQVTSNLKELRIYQCTRLEKLHMPAETPKLTYLDFCGLQKLRTLHLGMTPNLETLKVNDCRNMVELRMPAECPKLVHLDINKLKLRTLHLGITPNLKILRLRNCADMVKLRMHAECPKLVYLDIKRLKLTTLHLGITPNLETLRLRDCADMVELRMPAECPKLTYLDLRNNAKLRALDVGLTSNLEMVAVENCTEMVELYMPAECPKLVTLYLDNLKLRTLDLSVAPNLETLILNNCKKLVEVHFQVTPNLKELRMYKCYSLENLQMPAESQKLINLSDCTDMVEVRLPAKCPNLETLILKYCGRFKSFEFEKKLDSTDVVSLPELHLSVKACDADDTGDADDTDDADDTGDADDTDDVGDTDDTHDADDTNDADDTGICDPGNIWQEFKYSCYYKEDPASSFGNLEKLIPLGFGARINVDSFSDIICGLQCLRKLTLKGGIPEAPKNLDRLDCLEELSLQSTDIKTLPDSICMLKHLKSLKVESCLLLEKLPLDIGRLECLENLILSECTLLQDLPNSICEMKRLICLELTRCIQVEKLPEEIGLLECLKELNIKCTGISHLPRSIHRLKGLRIVGDRGLLKSTGSCLFKIRRTSDDEDEMFCYIHE